MTEELPLQRLPKTLSELHDCAKCHGKLVGITIDDVGITRCGYCGEVVPYREFMVRELRLSQCPHCLCMTRTICANKKEICGKCRKEKWK